MLFSYLLRTIPFTSAANRRDLISLTLGVNSPSNPRLYTLHLTLYTLHSQLYTHWSSLIQKQFFEMLPADFTKQDAVKQAQVLGIGLNTLNKWLNKFVQSNDILHVAHGVYQKRIA